MCSGDLGLTGTSVGRRRSTAAAVVHFIYEPVVVVDDVWHKVCVGGLYFFVGVEVSRDNEYQDGTLSSPWLTEEDYEVRDSFSPLQLDVFHTIMWVGSLSHGSDEAKRPPPGTPHKRRARSGVSGGRPFVTVRYCFVVPGWYYDIYIYDDRS